MEVKSTKDYKTFNYCIANRPIEPKLVKILKDEFIEYGFSPAFHIVIGKDNMVIDGQHRLEASKELGIEVYYVIDENLTELDIPRFNNKRKDWIISNYVRYWEKKGKVDYSIINNFAKRFKFTISVAVELLTGSHGSGKWKEIRDGELKIDRKSVEVADARAEQIVDILEILDCKSVRLIRSLDIYVLTNPEYDHAYMVKKLKENAINIKPSMTQDEYVSELQKVYNKGKSNRVVFKDFNF